VSTEPRAPKPSPHASVPVICALSLVLATCSLLYELLIAQTVTLIAGNMVTWYSLTVGVYLAAMGTGAIVFGARTSRRPWGWPELFRLEIVLSVLGGSAVLLLHGAHSLYLVGHAWSAPAWTAFGFFASAILVTILIGLLTGMELPLLIRLGHQAAGGRNVANRVLGWDYIGALVAGVAFPTLLVPNFPLLTIGFVVASINMAAAVFVLLLCVPSGALRRWGGVVSAVVCGVLGIALWRSPDIEQFILKKYYFYLESAESVRAFLSPLDELPRVVREHSPYQKIDRVHDPHPARYDVLTDAYSTKFQADPNQPTNRYLFLNNALQVSGNYEDIYHEWFAHVPIVIAGQVPREILVMGAGDGLLLRELVKYAEVKRIVHVDLDAMLVRTMATDTVFAAMNDHAFDDPRIETIFADGFQFLRDGSKGTYDAIYLDFPNAEDYNLSRLYSREFYHFVRERLAEDGFVALDAPHMVIEVGHDAFGNPYPMHGGTWGILSNTLRQAGFRTVLPYYSNLESDNPLAYERLVRSEVFQREAPSLATQEDKFNWMLEYVSYFASKLRNSFILARKDVRTPPFEYSAPPVALHVLNAKRFEQSFPAPPSPDALVEARLVNSILRPTLPRPGLGKIHTPW